jgi:hypothetical protein
LLVAACSSGEKKPAEGAGPGVSPRDLADFAPPPAPRIPGTPTADGGAAGERDSFFFSSPGGRGPSRGTDGRPAPTRPERPAATRPEPAPPPRTAPSRPNAGPVIEVVWEALAREKVLLETSRWRRNRGAQAPQKITLISQSHPDAAAVVSGRSAEARERFGQVSILKDEDMLMFLRGLRQGGFYRHARAMGDHAPVLRDDNARGRITVVRDGSSSTLVSMRGQGRSPATRDIPRIYSQTKQAIMVLKNMSPQLNVSHVGRDPLRR